jgi:ABC-type glycerol-3-phosphate transport system substrate-binding protein
MAASRQIRKQRVRRIPAEELKGEIAQVLQATRDEKGHTLAKAAKEMQMDPKGPSAKGGKASVFNIEAGHVFLPWKRVVSYAKYTGKDPARVLIALAAAKALSDIDDGPERERLRATLLELLELESLSDLLRAPDRSSIEAKRETVKAPKRFQFWHDFGGAFPASKESALKFNPIRGAYAEKALEEVLAQENQQRLVFQDDGGEGIELTIKSYLDIHRRFVPVYINAADIKHSPLDTVIDRQLNYSSLRLRDIADALFLVVYNLTDNNTTLRHVAAEVGRVTDRHPRSRTIFLAQESQVLNPDILGAVSYLTIPFSRSTSLGIVRSCLRRISRSDSTESFDDWTYLAIRHPLWLGIVCSLLSETNTVPSKWTMVREGATILTYGVANGRSAPSLLFDSILGRKQADYGISPSFVQGLAKAAVAALGSSTETQSILPVDLKDVDILRLGGPLVERVAGWRFTSTWIHYYFAALDCLRRIEKATEKKNAADRVLRELSALFDKGEYQKIQAREIVSALCHEAQHYDPKVNDLIRKQLETSNSVLSDPIRMPPLSAVPSSRIFPHRKLDSNTVTLRVMVEGQDPGFQLRRLASSVDLRTPSQAGTNDAMVVETLLVPYSFLREYISAAVRDDRDHDLLADIIVCPHFSLAWQLRNLAVEIRNQEIPLLSRLGFLANHFCKSNGKWFGIPVQYPTKYLCYRKKIIERPPTSLAGLVSLMKKHRDESGRRILGLQCRPRHPSLYYEWLAFVVASGGGDVVWTDALGRGEIILDSAATISATNKFLGIVMEAHRDSRNWDWDLIVTAMASRKIDVCLPFSDTVSELNRAMQPGELSYAPFQLNEGLTVPYVSNRLVGLNGAPLHIFTGHIMVALNHHVEMKVREFRFMEWFLRQDTQREFAKSTKQIPVLDTEVERVKESEEEFSSRVAREYAFLPVQGEFASTPDQPLSGYQMIVLDTISDLIVGTERGRPSPDTVEHSLKIAANKLRTEKHV